MKKYLFGLGTMIVGAGLMFVLMHGEVSAEDEKVYCDIMGYSGSRAQNFKYCKIRDLTCVSTRSSWGEAISCVKS
jgi:hypothetical protein